MGFPANMAAVMDPGWGLQNWGCTSYSQWKEGPHSDASGLRVVSNQVCAGTVAGAVIIHVAKSQQGGSQHAAHRLCRKAGFMSGNNCIVIGFKSTHAVCFACISVTRTLDRVGSLMECMMLSSGHL